MNTKLITLLCSLALMGKSDKDIGLLRALKKDENKGGIELTLSQKSEK